MDIWTRIATRPERERARHVIMRGRELVEAAAAPDATGGKLPHAELTRLRVIAALAQGR